jgi:hypothetical protein
MRPELSIVISVRDNWRQLAECVDSIANQDAPPRLEVVVIEQSRVRGMYNSEYCVKHRLELLPREIAASN